MTDLVLVLNAGSSSLKFQVVDPASGEVRVSDHLERVDESGGFEAALAAMQESVEAAGIGRDDLVAVGHRVVHGGDRLRDPTLVDDEVVATIEHLVRLAPLHNPPALAGIRAALATYDDLPQVAVFDTGFFADLPPAAATYAIDRDVAAAEGIRRYGAHGISHGYVAGEVARALDRDLDELDQVVLHLGNGASAAAISGGRPVDTSMGLTPLEGLVMGTRPGDIDAGVLLHLLRHGDLDVDGLEDLLHHRSGLEGLAGGHDVRDLVRRLGEGDPDVCLAWDVYCRRIRKYVGAYLAVLGGADAVTFTAGVGENVPVVRRDALAGLEPLGVVLDPARNEACAGPDGPVVVSADRSAVAVLVVPTNEELAIARDVVALLG
ncbi:acetate kinase (plasmid) [Georgenia sp. TF02-10]|uniref:acetate/propionate family kinase n=1 Tax=Georgenia sp. TF02-10 TaxID=2917725 RepID=UPI001FA7EF33|nr:acetate kinase [Georgenia sp. TF02-10]UNX56652.1 acetate kinase [Georgenia sp. TF02-10]